jgi:hypothetical protein
MYQYALPHRGDIIMPQAPKQHPRQFALLGPGPWLRPHPVFKRCIGLLFLVAVLTLVVIIVRIQRVPPVSDRHMLSTWLLGAVGLAAAALFTLGGLWVQESDHQYCPDCLQYMTRGARVCPYCGFRDEQAPAAALPTRRPRRSA